MTHQSTPLDLESDVEARLATRDAVLILTELRHQLAPDDYDTWEKLFHACEYLVRGATRTPVGGYLFVWTLLYPHIINERVLERHQQYQTRRS